MMALIFASLSGARLAGWSGRRKMSIGLVVATLLLATYLFLGEVDSPVYGFRMPWLKT